MNIVRSFLLMLALLLAVDVPKAGAEIGAGSFAASAVVGGVAALVSGYRTTKRKYEKKQARKQEKAAQSDDASSENSAEDIKQSKPFSLGGNLFTTLRNISPVAFVQGAAGSLAALYAADQFYSFDQIDLGIDPQVAAEMRTLRRNIWYWTQWAARATGAAIEVGCSRAYELTPEFRGSSALRAMPLATLIASYKMFKNAYEKAQSKAEKEHKEISLYKDFPAIWQEKNWSTFKRWFGASGFLLYIIDGFVQHEIRGLEAAEHPQCPRAHSQARKAYVRAYARHENPAWAQQVAQRVAVSAADSPAADAAVIQELQQLDRFQRNELQRIYIEENFNDIIAEAQSGFINDFHDAFQQAELDLDASRDDATNDYIRGLRDYWQRSYVGNEQQFQNYAHAYLRLLNVQNIDRMGDLVDAACRIAHYAAFHCLDNNRQRAGQRALKKLLSGKSAPCAAGFGIFSSMHPQAATVLGIE